MRLLMWLLLGYGAAGLNMWLISRPWFPSPALAGFMSAGLAGVATIGAFWMMYAAIRYENRPLPYIFLAFVPFTSLWYYFDRIRPTRRNSGEPRE